MTLRPIFIIIMLRNIVIFIVKDLSSCFHVPNFLSFENVLSSLKEHKFILLLKVSSFIFAFFSFLFCLIVFFCLFVSFVLLFLTFHFHWLVNSSAKDSLAQLAKLVYGDFPLKGGYRKFFFFSFHFSKQAFSLVSFHDGKVLDCQ